MLSENIDITTRHTFGIATTARAWGEYASVDELRNLLREVKRRNLEFMPIGEGSNLLFVRPYVGALLRSRIVTLQSLPTPDGRILVKAGSGWCWDEFVAHCVSQGWGGIENLSHIPGTVGASAVQNIGAYGVEVCDVIVSIEALDVDTLEVVEIDPSNCEYGYRTSRFKGSWRGKYIVTSVTYALTLSHQLRLHYGNLCQRVGESPSLQDVRDAVIATRREKLPEVCELGSAGSFFVNPIIERSHYDALLAKYPDMPCYEVDEKRVKVPAGWLIEHAGWKGKSVGGARVYEKQSLVIVNSGNATAAHVVQLANDIAFSVFETYQIIITREVNYI